MITIRIARDHLRLVCAEERATGASPGHAGAQRSQAAISATRLFLRRVLARFSQGNEGRRVDTRRSCRVTR